MKIAYCSDLHVDFWVSEVNPQNPKTKTKLKKYIEDILKPVPADVLIVAGDIGHYNLQNIELLKLLKEYYAHVIVVTGNHDMYLINQSTSKKYKHDSFKRLTEFYNFCSANGIVCLNGTKVTIDGITIGGTSMWYNLPRESDIIGWKTSMNDSRLIKSGKVNEFYVPLAYSGGYWHIESTFDTQKYYENEVAKLRDLGECDVFVSHVLPIVMPDDVRDSRYSKNDRFNIFYESDNIELLKATGATKCIFGHTHINAKFQQDGIDFYASAIGYPSENKYNTIEVFEI